ncbi:carbamoyl-phosphate synthase (glutamine-hydrolyzing) cpa2 [Knufia fluminis]|uniref:Carbamoyl-phosphate synthase (Glutamine-hydrolyzing) cpa2 n=1 Tax=Knufia fluminis TaxID=191047 RepID=A0AAN8I6B6_9EURO|nr:carbamoyl-phosphate synthase (glutamine-hydrolyzing) cpa2 [Knufia fluminis]
MELYIDVSSEKQICTVIQDRLPFLLANDKQASEAMKMFHEKRSPDWFLGVQTKVHPDVPEILSGTKPTVQWFKDLPSPTDIGQNVMDGSHVLYCVVLEHPDATAQASDELSQELETLYYTQTTHLSWLGHFRLRSLQGSPFYVKESLEQGWKVVHVGILLLVPFTQVPPTEYAPPQELSLAEIRGWVQTLEGFFHFFLWTFRANPNFSINDLRAFCPRTELERDGLNTHSSLKEAANEGDVCGPAEDIKCVLEL